MSKSQNGADIPDKNEFVKNLGLSETVELARNAVSVNGGIIKAGLNVQNVLSVGMNPEKNLRISSSENAESQINLFVWGDSNNRKTIFECGDKNGCLFYSHRLSSNNVELFSAGKIIPADYQNFDARYDNIPIGVPMPYPHKYAPVGYLTCNGQTFDKSLYPKLAEAYPNGRLPDLRGEFIRGWDDSRGVDMERACGSWQPASIQDHTHYKVISRQVVEDLVLTGNEAWSTERNSAYTRSLDQNASTGGIVGTTANETRPRNVAFNYIVRAA
ncbi:phage tail protein [Photorhabdus caribbeanensis]|uniref:phage tail protein n=1 Tax=Photorhabdus caribbeanensis TaxID=1004165 RepID=UPI003BB492DA